MGKGIGASDDFDGESGFYVVLLGREPVEAVGLKRDRTWPQSLTSIRIIILPQEMATKYVPS